MLDDYADSSLAKTLFHSKSHIHHNLIRYGLTGFLASRPALPDHLGPRTEHACAGFSPSTNQHQQVNFTIICNPLILFLFLLFFPFGKTDLGNILLFNKRTRKYVKCGNICNMNTEEIRGGHKPTPFVIT